VDALGQGGAAHQMSGRGGVIGGMDYRPILELLSVSGHVIVTMQPQSLQGLSGRQQLLTQRGLEVALRVRVVVGLRGREWGFVMTKSANRGPVALAVMADTSHSKWRRPRY